ncbi:centromere protein N isoform X1 [Girardinichthys multiradiatus]|uniref:centromere protein N isoform X1 n=1 Tax=Girardinichthys multiradiatus TaxID=208333 RepID=UPI001FADDBFB|nr:centromere protein N isoform X1 [Girardinichthys multiradiatus]
MDDSAKRLLQRLVRRIPTQMLRDTLDKWERLTAKQREFVDFTQSKWTITQELLAVCEERELSVKHIAELEMIYVIGNPNQGMWHTFQLVDAEDDAHSLELVQFKEQFKSHLSELKRNVAVKIKKHTDEAVWIRIAWGDTFSRPNHLKATYVVHYLQTPFVFVSGLLSKHKPLLLQALTLSTRHQGIKDANLSGQKLTAIRDLLMRQYQHVFPTKYPSPLAERNRSVSSFVHLDPHIENEQAEASANRHRMAGEAFGNGMLPALQSAVYKLETKFRDLTNETMTERDKPLRCVVKFSSPNILESLRHCASTGIASTPVTPLLSSIPLKGRNYFVITDNAPSASSQMCQTQD